MHKEVQFTNLKERERYGDRMVIFKRKLNELKCQGLDWIQLAQDTAYWRPTVNMVMKLEMEDFLAR
jgi:hypothetical protein